MNYREMFLKVGRLFSNESLDFDANPGHDPDQGFST